MYTQAMSKNKKNIRTNQLKIVTFAAIKIRIIFHRRVILMQVLGISVASQKHLRIKVIPDLHLTYSKNGENLGLVLKQ